MKVNSNCEMEIKIKSPRQHNKWTTYNTQHQTNSPTYHIKRLNMFPQGPNTAQHSSDQQRQAQSQKERQDSSGEHGLLIRLLAISHIHHTYCHEDQREELES